MFDLETTKKRKSVIVLQLAPMIDIFVLVIVFLLKGTVLTETVISSPTLVDAPKSESHEVTELAPEVYITETDVEFRMIQEKIPISEILKDEVNMADPKLAKFRAYIAQAAATEGNTLTQVNIVADYKTSYKAIFHVVRLLRIAGFKAMLFIAEGNET